MKTISLLAVLFVLVFSSAHAQDENAWPSQYYAPYVQVGSLPLAATAEVTGIRYFTLAFMLASDDCAAAWDGASLLKNATYLNSDLEQLRELGGDVLVSFGGAAGDELALKCLDVASLTAQYQAVIDAYQITHLDFDIEGDEIQDAESIERRSKAIAALQSQNEQEIYVAFTLPVLPNGLPHESVTVLQSAIDNGVNISNVNLMTMDFGHPYQPDEMGDNTIEAANRVFKQLQKLYPDKTDAEVWGMIGLTPMIGLNDVVPEVFTLDDAQAVLSFAQENAIGRISMWSLGRDQECVSKQKIVSSKCSGTEQDEFAYSAIFNQFMDVGF